MYRMIFAISLMLTPSTSNAQSPLSTNVWIEPHHSSTWDEGVRRGQAACWRSYGEYLYLRALGCKAWEDARGQYIQNRRNVLYFWDEWRKKIEQQREREQERCRNRGPNDLPKKLLPQRLNVGQLGFDGQIQWPDLLLADEYCQQRNVLEELFRQRAYGTSTGQQAKCRKAIDGAAGELLAELARRLTDYTPADYVTARNFIESLRYEARFDHPIPLASR